MGWSRGEFRLEILLLSDQFFACDIVILKSVSPDKLTIFEY